MGYQNYDEDFTPNLRQLSLKELEQQFKLFWHFDCPDYDGVFALAKFCSCYDIIEKYHQLRHFIFVRC